jgi:dipeptidyl aminopeptidase/acylaminoacyl peptidase
VVPATIETGGPEAVVTTEIAKGPQSVPAQTPGVAITGAAHAFTWSANSGQLAFVADADTGSASTFYVRSMTAGKTRQVALLPGAFASAQLSPDGTQIAVLYSSPDEQANGPTAASPRDTGAIGDHVDRQHLALVNVATGALRVISPPDLYVYEFGWAPDGQQLVISAAHGSGNNNWWVARLYAITAASGALRDIAKPTTQIAVPQWSPDGSTIAYIGGLMSDQSVTGGDVYAVPAAGGEPRDVTPGTRVSVSSIAWQRDSRTLTVAAWAQGGSAIATIDMLHGTMHTLWSADELATAGDVSYLPGVAASADGRTVGVIRESLNTPPEVWLGPAEHLQQFSLYNRGAQPSVGKAVSVKWRSDSFDVQGWLVYPRTFTAGQRYPLIVDVHGGPAYAWPSSYVSHGSLESTLSRAGYFVFFPNPRGSYGQGEAFTRANIKDFGYGDLRDIMAGVDTVLRQFPVDSARLGITGWSYGGFMTMWAVTQTHRFRAAVSGAGLSDWLSYTGENGISEWMVPYFGATAYEDPAVYAKSSPINFIDQAKTPTLIVVGERDVECPAPQSFEFWRGLQHAGVRTELIVYPDEGHGFTNPAHERDANDRSLHWFDTYLGKATVVQ